MKVNSVSLDTPIVKNLSSNDKLHNKDCSENDLKFNTLLKSQYESKSEKDITVPRNPWKKSNRELDDSEDLDKVTIALQSLSAYLINCKENKVSSEIEKVYEDLNNSIEKLSYEDIEVFLSTDNFESNINLDNHNLEKLSSNLNDKDFVYNNNQEYMRNIKEEICLILNEVKNLHSQGFMTNEESFNYKLINHRESIINDDNLEMITKEIKNFLHANKNTKPEIQNSNGNFLADYTSIQKSSSIKQSEELLKDMNLGSDDSREKFLKDISKDKKEESFFNKVNLNLMKLEGLKGNSSEVSIPKQPIVRGEFLQNDIIKWMKYMDLNNVKEISLKVIPKELGEIVLKVSLESGAMKAEILSNNKDTYKVLQNNILDITNKLENESVKIQEVSVNIYGEDYMGAEGERFKENNANESFKRKDGRKSIDSIEGVGNEPEKEEDILNNEVLNKLA
ncbi:flagellar hook-length control protein FliK [Hathewaya histolytica]|uniref:Flagellar hook-length control protein fliK n=1 Tax=Hathewaya histolytica TaxID=1498 RepID=A0A4U9R9E8_HATHI|nr:flagellar hook-length control protein FliK [Hathewaya histolytica]VTQ87706.1 flagellar hook-length control protein fliK [Hathewaya histolytica]